MAEQFQISEGRFYYAKIVKEAKARMVVLYRRTNWQAHLQRTVQEVYSQLQAKLSCCHRQLQKIQSKKTEILSVRQGGIIAPFCYKFGSRNEVREI